MAIAGVALASVLMAASVGCGTEVEAPANPSPSPSASTSVEASPSPSASPAETMPTVESLEIDDSLIRKPKALIETFVDKRVTEWFNAGATIENTQAAHDSNVYGIKEFAAIAAAKYDKIFIEALLVKDWKSNSEIVKWVDKMKSIHQQTLALYFYTALRTDSNDIEPYMRGAGPTKIDSITNQTNKSLTVVTMDKNYDNADQNRVGEDLTDGHKVNNDKGLVTRTFTVVNGKTKLSDIILYYLPI